MPAGDVGRSGSGLWTSSWSHVARGVWSSVVLGSVCAEAVTASSLVGSVPNQA